MAGLIAIKASTWIRRLWRSGPDRVATAIAPDYALSSHVAPLGAAMYTGTDLPANYRGGAFVGEHGSWNRTPLNGYKVVFVPFSGGKASGPALIIGQAGFSTEAGQLDSRARRRILIVRENSMITRYTDHAANERTFL